MCFTFISVYADSVPVVDVQFRDDMTSFGNYMKENGLTELNYYIKFQHNNKEYNRITFVCNGIGQFEIRYYAPGSYWEAYKNGVWKGEPSYIHIVLYEYPQDELKAIIDEYAECIYYGHGEGETPPPEPEAPPACDGSTCTVRDFDVNGVCDTCGNDLAYTVQRTYTPNGWGSYPLPLLGYGADSKYIIIQDAVGDKWLYALTPSKSGETWYTSSYGDTAQRIWLEDADGIRVNLTFRSYLLDDINNEWEQKVSNTLTELNFSREEAVVYYSSLELYNEDGTLFFPQPLWMEVQKGFTLTQLMDHLMGTMGQLTIAGIGLIALLIGLILLVKVLRKSVRN